MNPTRWKASPRRDTPRVSPTSTQPVASVAPAGPPLNTILAVREHAPAEIVELSEEIQALHHRLGAAYARKKLLERLLQVIQQSDEESPLQSGISVMR